MKLKPLLILLPVFFTGCAVISENECRAGLWYERGLQDGARGRSQSLVYQLAQKCHEYGARVDTEEWLRGHELGVEQFCTPENAFHHGHMGRNYEGVCSGPAADLFMAEYQRGLALRALEQEHRKLQQQRTQLVADLEAVQQALDASDDHVEVRALMRQQEELKRDLRNLDREIRRLGPI